MSFIPSSFLKGSFISGVVAIFVGFCGYWVRRMMANSLPENDYAFYYSFYALVNFCIMFSQAGLSDVMLFELPGMLENKKIKRAAQCYNYTKRIQTVLSFAVTLLFIACYGLLKKYYFDYPVDFLCFLVFTLLLWGFTLEFSILNALNALNKFSTMSFLRAIKAGACALTVWIFLKSDTPLLGIISSCVIITTICTLIGDWICKKRTIFHNTEMPSATLKKILIRSGFVFILLNGSKIILMDAGTIVLSFFSTPAEVVLFNVALPIAMIVQSMLVVLNVFTPLIAQCCANQDIQRLKKLFSLMFIITTAGMLLWIPFYYFAGELLITILFAKKFIAAKLSMFFMVEAALLAIPINALMYLFNTAGLKSVSLKGLIPMLASALFLLPWLSYKYGATGAGIAVFAVTLIWLCTYLLYYVNFIKRNSHNKAIFFLSYMKQRFNNIVISQNKAILK